MNHLTKGYSIMKINKSLSLYKTKLVVLPLPGIYNLEKISSIKGVQEKWV